MAYNVTRTDVKLNLNGITYATLISLYLGRFQIMQILNAILIYAEININYNIVILFQYFVPVRTPELRLPLVKA